MVEPKVFGYKLGHALLLALAVVPSALGYSVYMTDLPNGILRIALDLKLADDPGASAFYTYQPVLIPNMTLDVWGMLVGRWIGAEAAVSLLVALSLVLLYTAVQALRVASVGRTSLLAGAISLLLIQSGTFRWGLVNYEIGVGIVLWSMAVAEYQDERGRLGSTGTILLRAVLALLAVMSSIFSIAILSCHAAGRLLPMLWGGRRAWSWDVVRGLSLPMIPPVIFLAFAQKKPPGLGYETVWTLYGKISGWVSLFYVRGPGLELPLAFALAALLVLAVTTLHGRVDRRLWAFLGLLMLIYMLVPSRLFNVDAVDYRFAQPMALVALAGMGFSLRDGSGWTRWGKGVTLAFMVLAVCKSLVSIGSLSPIRDLRTELTRDLQVVPAGATLLVATNLPDFRFQGHRIWHLPLLSVADLGRDIFSPSLFSNFFTHEKKEDDGMPDWVDEGEILTKPIVCEASHVVMIGDGSRAQVLAANLPARIVASSENAVVFAIDQQGCRDRWIPLPETASGRLRSTL
jgi:hypothetical protein